MPQKKVEKEVKQSNQLRINTSKLQEMMAKAVKGASQNKMIPITGLINIEVKSNVLIITTTDATNYLKVIEDKVDNDDFYVTLEVDKFSKLIAKTTAEMIVLTLKENSLEVKGNGTYNIELPLDEEGQLIRFPQYKFNSKLEKQIINLSSIKSVLNANKAAVAETLENPVLTGYYFNEKVLTTDGILICANDLKIFDKAVILPAELMELLALIDKEKIDVQIDNKKMLFSTDNIIIYGLQLEDIEDYPVEPINGYLETEFKNMCKLPKQALLSVLDRLLLFVTDYDRNAVNLTFTKQGLIIASKNMAGTELIKYQGSENFQPFACCVSIELLKSQITTHDVEAIELWYGHEQALKLVNGKVTQIVALYEDESNGE